MQDPKFFALQMLACAVAGSVEEAKRDVEVFVRARDAAMLERFRRRAVAIVDRARAEGDSDLRSVRWALVALTLDDEQPDEKP